MLDEEEITSELIVKRFQSPSPMPIGLEGMVNEEELVYFKTQVNVDDSNLVSVENTNQELSQLIRKGQVTEAKKLYESLLSEDSRIYPNSTTRRIVAQMFFEIGETDRAIATCREIIKRKPEFTSMMLMIYEMIAHGYVSYDYKIIGLLSDIWRAYDKFFANSRPISHESFDNVFLNLSKSNQHETLFDLINTLSTRSIFPTEPQINCLFEVWKQTQTCTYERCWSLYQTLCTNHTLSKQSVVNLIEVARLHNWEKFEVYFLKIYRFKFCPCGTHEERSQSLHKLVKMWRIPKKLTRTVELTAELAAKYQKRGTQEDKYILYPLALEALYFCDLSKFVHDTSISWHYNSTNRTLTNRENPDVKYSLEDFTNYVYEFRKDAGIFLERQESRNAITFVMVFRTPRKILKKDWLKRQREKEAIELKKRQEERSKEIETIIEDMRRWDL